MLPPRHLLVTACALAAPGLARADGWFVAEAPAAVAVSDAQQGVFRPGAMPAVGAYADNDWFALGARLRVGALRNGPSPGGGLEDPGYGGLVTAGLAMRVQRLGGWVELVGGGGITGSDLVPSYEIGAGWVFAVRGYDVGPSARFVRVVSRDDMAAFGSADLVVVGVDVRWGKQRPVRAVHPVYVAPVTEPVIAPDAVGFADRDADRVIEEPEASCLARADGCPLTEHITMFEDRIVLDERVLFELGKARVRSSGRAVIGDIARLWRAHPEWKRITIEGHCDVRGSDELNHELSQRRAHFARAALVKEGFDPSLVDAAGYGRSRPRVVDARRESEHEKNRRVEFVIERVIPEVSK